MTDVADKKWHQQYEQLLEFQGKNGHCLVPHKYEEDASLGEWVHNQRKLHVNNKLRLDRKELLEKIEFVWRVDKSRYKDAPLWKKQYEKLVAFQRKNGHCLVPRGYKEDASFGLWVSCQRGLHVNNKLRLDRKDLLNKIGFAWRVDKYARWNKQYEKLVAFKRKNGHCIVPQKYQEDASLGKWVDNQRTAHTNNKMRPDRKKLLDEIDFVWKADTLAAAARSSTTNVRGLIIASFHALFRIFF
jgi:hypothetical protein